MFTFVIVFCDVLCKSYIVALFTVVHISTFVAQNVSNKAFSNSNSNSSFDCYTIWNFNLNDPVRFLTLCSKRVTLGSHNRDIMCTNEIFITNVHKM